MPTNLGGGGGTTNQVYTPKGYVSWGAGASYDPSSGFITNVSNESVVITTPNGAIKLSPNMTYNVKTGEIGF
jgi:hypothetical protein